MSTAQSVRGPRLKARNVQMRNGQNLKARLKMYYTLLDPCESNQLSLRKLQKLSLACDNQQILA